MRRITLHARGVVLRRFPACRARAVRSRPRYREGELQARGARSRAGAAAGAPLSRSGGGATRGLCHGSAGLAVIFQRFWQAAALRRPLRWRRAPHATLAACDARTTRAAWIGRLSRARARGRIAGACAPGAWFLAAAPGSRSRSRRRSRRRGRAGSARWHPKHAEGALRRRSVQLERDEHLGPHRIRSHGFKSGADRSSAVVADVSGHDRVTEDQRSRSDETVDYVQVPAHAAGACGRGPPTVRRRRPSPQDSRREATSQGCVVPKQLLLLLPAVQPFDSPFSAPSSESTLK